MVHKVAIVSLTSDCETTRYAVSSALRRPPLGTTVAAKLSRRLSGERSGTSPLRSVLVPGQMVYGQQVGQIGGYSQK